MHTQQQHRLVSAYAVAYLIYLSQHYFIKMAEYLLCGLPLQQLNIFFKFW